MRRFVGMVILGTMLAGAGVAQAEPTPVGPAPGAESAPRPAYSAEGRAALATGRALLGTLRGLRGAERKSALERVATAHDRIAEQFAAEPAVAAAATFAAAELWRQQGSLPLAERDYLRAAELDAPRFAQRGLLGAADMQRRQQRAEEALATYAKAEAVEPGSSRAQEARLWRGRVLQETGRLDAAIPVFESALEAAERPRQVIDASNLLALAWIAKDHLDAAERVLEHAERVVETAAEDEPEARERHRKALEAMSARRALQRVRDERSGAAADAVRLDAERRAGAAN